MAGGPIKEKGRKGFAGRQGQNQVAITILGRRKRRKLWIRVDKLTGWQF
jgi:hypothetical protein